MQVTVQTQVPLAGEHYTSPEDMYSSLTSSLAAAVADGSYTSSIQYFVQFYDNDQLDAATATAVTSSNLTVSVIENTFAPTMQPTLAPYDVEWEVASLLPGILMMFVGTTVVCFRRKRSASLNELHEKYNIEYVEIAIRSVIVCMAFNVLFNVGFYTTNYVFGLLLLARLLIFAMSAVCFALFVVPAKNQVNRRTGISLLMNMEALEDANSISVYSLVIFVSIFDTTMLLYLPWHRTAFTGIMGGFPNMSLLRCTLYGAFLSSCFQIAASVLSIANKPLETVEVSVVLLVFSMLNVVRTFIAIVLTMKKANSAEFKVAIVSKSDVAALADWVKSTNSVDSGSVRSWHEPATFTADKVSEMLSAAESRPISHQDGRDDSTQESGELEMSAANPIHRISEKKKVEPVEQSQKGEDNNHVEEEGVEIDERGIRFSTDIHYADETVNILREQMRTAGLTPLEFIPLPKIKEEMAQLFECANTGVAYDTDRLDYLLLCLDHNPEHKAEQEAISRAWFEEIQPLLVESLEIMRSFIPPHIFQCSEVSLVEDDGYSKALAKRIIAKKCLWLVRVSTSDIERMHVVELSGRFNPEAQGLDLVETAAIFAVLPAKFTNDSDRKKTRWRASIEQSLKTMYAQNKAGSLAGPKKRNLVYKNQLPKYAGRDTLHEMSGVKKGDVFGPRTSFLSLGKDSPSPAPESLETKKKSTATSTTSSTSRAIGWISSAFSSSNKSTPPLATVEEER